MRSVTNLYDAFHHAHHLVDDGNNFVRPLRGRHVGPVRRRQDVAAGHVQDVGGRQLEVDRGAVGVVDDGRKEGVFSCKRRRDSAFLTIRSNREALGAKLDLLS